MSCTRPRWTRHLGLLNGRRPAAPRDNHGSERPSLENAIAAKTVCTRTAFKVASDAVQLFGANGLSQDYPVEKFFRDARVSMIEDGSNDVLGLVAARQILLHRHGE